jgi:site-specific DNA-methyltransferase (adenine-specific)
VNRSEIAGKDGGRWPAHITFDEDAAAILDRQQCEASRFFYVAKPNKQEKGEWNTHPTVKSVELMRWFVRLITPSGGLVLDPFMGSGSTGVACIREGFDFLGIEQEKEYFEIAQKRIGLTHKKGR